MCAHLPVVPDLGAEQYVKQINSAAVEVTGSPGDIKAPKRDGMSFSKLWNPSNPGRFYKALLPDTSTLDIGSLVACVCTPHTTAGKPPARYLCLLHNTVTA